MLYKLLDEPYWEELDRRIEEFFKPSPNFILHNSRELFNDPEEGLTMFFVDLICQISIGTRVEPYMSRQNKMMNKDEIKDIINTCELKKAILFLLERNLKLDSYQEKLDENTLPIFQQAQKEYDIEMILQMYFMYEITDYFGRNSPLYERFDRTIPDWEDVRRAKLEALKMKNGKFKAYEEYEEVAKKAVTKILIEKKLSTKKTEDHVNPYHKNRWTF